MAIVAGTRLGPYEITGSLGAGGMAEVYSAHDTRLARDVAIKVLPDSLAAHADRLRRFEQEARVVGALNHPNVVGIFDVGAQDGIHYLVTELLHGTTLRERIDGHALPSRKVKEYALQLARGLSAAHEKGIVHRDLKPENIFITRDEQVKILDFGLAKDVRVLQAEATATVSKTAEGVVMGTAGYMSPEQVRGTAVDHRTDIFSFGAVLYEMISGQRAFHRDSSVETMNAILKEEPPDLEAARVSTTPGLERVMRRCLEKVPERRFQSASDLAFAIEAMSETTVSSAAQKIVPPQRPRSLPVVLALVALLATASAFFAGSYFFRPRQPFYRPLAFGPGYVVAARFTPDGQNVIYGAAWNGKPFEIFQVTTSGPGSRNLGLPPASILGISGNGDLALSLEHHSLYQWVNVGTLARAPLNGGAARPLMDDICDADITKDGKDFAVVRCTGSEQTLEYPVGHVLFRTSGYVDRLRFSRDETRIAFAEHPLAGDDRGFVSIVDTSGKFTRLSTEFPGIKGLAWSPSGDEIWVSSATGNYDNDIIWGVGLTGKQRKVLAAPGDVWIVDTHPNGKALVLNARSSSELVLHRQGQTHDEPIFSEGGDNTVGGLAAGGTLAVTNSGAGADYLTQVVTPQSPLPVALGEGNVCGISPDGKWVLSTLPSAPNKTILYPTGTGEVRRFDLAPVSNTSCVCSWSADGKLVVFTGSEPGKAPRAYAFELGSGKARAVTPEGTTDALLSPDGKTIIARQQNAYALFSVSGGSARPVRGLEHGEHAIGWHESNRKIFVWNGRFPAKLSLVDVETGKREPWLQLTPPDSTGLVWGTIVIAPDGKSYACRYRRILTTLFVVDGLR